MNANSIIAAIKSPDNRKAITIGCTAGVTVVVGACAIKVAGLGLAGKIAVGLVCAGFAGHAAKQAIDNGHLDSMVNSLEQELAHSKAQ